MGIKIDLSAIKKADRELKKLNKKTGADDFEKSIALMEGYSNTSEVDYDKFTPEYILKMAQYELESYFVTRDQVEQINKFIGRLETQPHAKQQHYAACL